MNQTDGIEQPIVRSHEALYVLVPSRGRPDSVRRMAKAWEVTGAWGDAKLIFVVDSDDPTLDGYFKPIRGIAGTVHLLTLPRWLPLVPKLNHVAAATVRLGDNEAPYAIAYFGDDHVPRTPGWAARNVAALRQLGSGFVYCDDGLQGANLPTQFAVTLDVVAALGAMVPAPVEHLYCDNVILELGKAANAITYLPEVLIEHMHPLAGKAALDEGYARFNSEAQYASDGARFREWMHSPLGLAAASRTLRSLRQLQAAPPL